MNYKVIFISLLCTCVFIGIGVYVYHFEYGAKNFNVHFLSLKRGRSIFIRTPEHRNILIGGGQGSEVVREITHLIPFYRRKIDVVIAPSSLVTHIGGLNDVLDRYEVETIFFPKIIATSTALTELMKKVRKKKIHIEELERGDVYKVESDVNINILFPHEDFSFNKTSIPELAFNISYKNTSAYFLGSVSKTIQKDVYTNMRKNKDSNIVEVYSTGVPVKIFQDLFKLLDPQFIFTTQEKTTKMISDGREWKKEK